MDVQSDFFKTKKQSVHQVYSTGPFPPVIFVLCNDSSDQTSQQCVRLYQSNQSRLLSFPVYCELPDDVSYAKEVAFRKQFQHLDEGKWSSHTMNVLLLTDLTALGLWL